MQHDTLVLTRFISAWSWHLIAVMFFLKSISFLIVHRYEWMVGMLGVFVVAEIIALRRKGDVERGEKEVEDDIENV